MRALLRYAWLIVVLSTAGQGRAHAQAAADADSAGYRDAIAQAVSEYEAGHFAESRALFRRAHRLQPSARTLRGLGMTEFELRNYAVSASFLEQALNSDVKPLDGTLRFETEELLSRTRGFVGRFVLVLDPGDASISVDGVIVHLDTNASIVLAVGDHALAVSAADHVTEHRTLQVTGGEQQTLRITLPSQAALTSTAAAPASTPAHEAPAARESSSVFSSPWLWAALGVVVVGAGVGTGIVLLSGDSQKAGAAYGGDSNMRLHGP